MFATYSPTWTNWTVGAYAGMTLGTNLDFGPTLFTDQSGNEVYAMGVIMVNITSGGFTLSRRTSRCVPDSTMT